MISVMTNELSLSAQRHLEQSNNRMHSTIQKLASGSRIVQASDDPAGLAISDSLNATVRSLGQAVRNAQDGMSMIQVFEGGTNEINNMLIRVRELAMQSASDTVGDHEREMLNHEVRELLSEVTRVAGTTNFNGTALLSGANIDLQFQVGTGNVDEVDRITFAPGDTDMTAGALGVEGVDVSDRGGAQGALESIDSALTHVNDIRARIGASQNRLNTTIVSQGIFRENLSAARARIKDADIAFETSNLARESILRQAGVSVLAQANQTPMLALKLLNG